MGLAVLGRFSQLKYGKEIFKHWCTVLRTSDLHRLTESVEQRVSEFDIGKAGKGYFLESLVTQ